MLPKSCVAVILLAVAVVGARAQAQKGPNGGVVVVSSGHPIEFVLRGQEILFYVRDDDGSPLPTKTMQGRATVQDSGKTTTIPLKASEPNLMTGTLSGPLGSKARVVFSGTFREDGHTHTRLPLAT